jgi:hypothetical protein
MSEELIRGLRAIADFLKLKKVGTVRHWQEKYHLPIRRDPSGQVFAVTSELVNWLIVYDAERSKIAQKQVYRGAVKKQMERKQFREELERRG